MTLYPKTLKKTNKQPINRTTGHIMLLLELYCFAIDGYTTNLNSSDKYPDRIISI